MLLKNRSDLCEIENAQITQYAMGTVMVHKAFGSNASDCLTAVENEIIRIENLLSRFIPDSDVCRINRSAGEKSEKISGESFALLSKAIEFSANCPGSFQVTIGPLVNLWSESKKTLSQPDGSSIEQALGLVNDQDLILNSDELSARLRKRGQSIDLGGIGKGYAADRIATIYKEYGITSAYSNLGGNVVSVGTKPDGSPWQIGIQHPRQENSLIGAVSIAGETVVTSGDYQRCFVDRNGNLHHHILDPRTGYPARSGLISVTIVTRQSLAADVLSTALFIAGIEKGLEFLQKVSETEAILITDDLQVFITSGLQHRFQAVQNLHYSIVE